MPIVQIPDEQVIAASQKVKVVEAQKIVCVNHAAIVAWFSVGYINDSGDPTYTSSTPSFPVGQQRGIDLDGEGIEEGTFCRPHVDGTGVINAVDGNKAIKYKKNGQTAVYEIKGTIFKLWCELL